MQTFLPIANIFDAPKLLDYRRLGKQRLECRQILKALQLGPGAPWYNHPATQMWKGFEPTLTLYYNHCVQEWIMRGYRNTMEILVPKWEVNSPMYPDWFGNPRFHAGHRSNLLRKDRGYYSQFGWTEPDDLPYWWPV